MSDAPILDYYRATDHGCSLKRIGDVFVEDTYAIGMKRGYVLFIVFTVMNLYKARLWHFKKILFLNRTLINSIFVFFRFFSIFFYKIFFQDSNLRNCVFLCIRQFYQHKNNFFN